MMNAINASLFMSKASNSLIKLSTTGRGLCPIILFGPKPEPKHLARCVRRGTLRVGRRDFFRRTIRWSGLRPGRILAGGFRGGVAHVLKRLHTARKLFGHDHPVLLVDGDP